jgi:hypothetical protein
VGPASGKKLDHAQPPTPSRDRVSKEIKPHRKPNMNFPSKNFQSR